MELLFNPIRCLNCSACLLEILEMRLAAKLQGFYVETVKYVNSVFLFIQTQVDGFNSLFVHSLK